MNLYICTKLSQWSSEVVTVIASNEEHCRDILKNDGRTGFSIEVFFPLGSDYVLADSGIPYSLEVENENYEG